MEECLITEDEYWDSDPEFQDDDDEVEYEFLIDEPDDLTLLMLPKYEFDLERTVDDYYKLIKKCRNKEQIKQVLTHFYGHISEVTILTNDIAHLQSRAKELEIKVEILRQNFG